MTTEKIKVLIVDDEAPAREKINRYVCIDPRFDVVGEAKNGKEAIEKISQLQPQLLLLDIQMPGMTGFDVLRLMDAGKPAVIFITAYDDYAVQAFEVSAVDYLLKPISEDRLQQALNKVLTLTQQNWDEQIVRVLLNLKQKQYIHRLAVRHARKIQIINVDEILYIHSEHRLINIYNDNNQRFWTNENLSQLEKRLDPDCFMRVHRSTIINLAAKFEIETWDSGRLRLHFANEKVVVASREYAAHLRSLFEF